MIHSLKEIVTGNTAKLTYVCEGIAYYNIEVGDSIYQIGLNSMEDEWKATYMHSEFKAITLMRWIRKGLETGALVKIK